MRTIVYVDGYNLYYGVLRKTAFKWLDLFGLFQDHVLDSQAQLVEVRYYTAPVLGRMCDDIESPQRQRQYLQALRKMYPEKIVIVEGKIIATTPFQRLVEPLEAALATVRRYQFNASSSSKAGSVRSGQSVSAPESRRCHQSPPRQTNDGPRIFAGCGPVVMVGLCSPSSWIAIPVNCWVGIYLDLAVPGRLRLRWNKP